MRRVLRLNTFVGGCLVALATVAIVLCIIQARSHESEILLSSGVALTPEWQQITSPRVLMTEAPWSDVVIELPTFDFRVVDFANGLLQIGGTSLKVDAYLVTEDAKEIKLDDVSSATFGTKVVLELSTRALHWKKRDYRFRTLALRSNRPVQTGKVIWMSYDPRETKSGVAFPRALM